MFLDERSHSIEGYSDRDRSKIEDMARRRKKDINKKQRRRSKSIQSNIEEIGCITRICNFFCNVINH